MCVCVCVGEVYLLKYWKKKQGYIYLVTDRFAINPVIADLAIASFGKILTKGDAREKIDMLCFRRE